MERWVAASRRYFNAEKSINILKLNIPEVEPRSMKKCQAAWLRLWQVPRPEEKLEAMAHEESYKWRKSPAMRRAQ